MKIGVVGLGKVGLVLAQVLRHVGKHEVVGYDVRPADDIWDAIEAQREPIPKGALTIAHDVRTVVLSSDVVYICVATPNVEFDATSRHSIHSENFDYTMLLDAIGAVSQEATKQQKHITLVVLSTVAPGIFAEKIFDAVEREFVSLVYSPSFISLGTVWQDLVDPKGILIGHESLTDALVVSQVWEPITDAHRISVSIESAEIIKMASNTIQFFKIQYINALAELANKTYADIDEVSDGLAKVLNHGWIPRAGMPDGGACRPRDVVAMTEVARQYNLNQLHSLMSALSEARALQFDKIAGDVLTLARRFPDLPILILGDSYKAGVTYPDGAPGIYLFWSIQALAGERSVSLVPTITGPNYHFEDKALYVIAVPWAMDLSQFPKGSVVYDVWGTTEDDINMDVTYVPPGRFNGF